MGIGLKPDPLVPKTSRSQQPPQFAPAQFPDVDILLKPPREERPDVPGNGSGLVIAVVGEPLQDTTDHRVQSSGERDEKFLRGSVDDQFTGLFEDAADFGQN